MIVLLADRRPIPSVLATTLAVIVSLSIGVAGLWALFTDTGRGESKWGRFLVTAVVYAIGAGAVGALVPRRWYLALLAAWGPVALGVIGLVAKLAHGGEVPYWRNLVVSLLVAPGVAAVFGYLGMKARVSNYTRSAP